MSLNDGFEQFFSVTNEILNCYNELMSLTLFDEDSVDKYFLIFEKLEILVKEEFENYNKFTKDDLTIYLNILTKMNGNDLDLKEMRIGFRLSCIYDRMKNNTINLKNIFPNINIDMELGMVDLINSKIVIDTYKLINSKLNSLFCYDEKSNLYADRLGKLNMQNAFYKISMYETSELLAINALYDLDRIASIDMKLIEDLFYKKFNKKLDIHDILCKKIYTTIIDLIDRLHNNKLDVDSAVSIYDNLFLVSQIEILIDYLSMDELFKIALYFDNIDISSKMISNNVRRLIKKQFDKYFN